LDVTIDYRITIAAKKMYPTEKQEKTVVTEVIQIDAVIAFHFVDDKMRHVVAAEFPKIDVFCRY
jgi:hypothetical protein